jgi:hypothetical protein
VMRTVEVFDRNSGRPRPPPARYDQWRRSSYSSSSRSWSATTRSR